MHIKNLTNSPFDLVNESGEKVRLPAAGSVEINPHPMHINHYRQVGYFEITDSSAVNPETENDSEPDAIESLRSDYEDLAGKPADKRWSESRLQSEIEKLMESDGE